jgi:hypothetical protein
VLVWEGSANRDAAVFDRADRFDVARKPNPHLGFGQGVHYCLGANLARLELRVLYEELLTRFAGIDVVKPVEWARSNRHTGIRTSVRRVRLSRQPAGGLTRSQPPRPHPLRQNRRPHGPRAVIRRQIAAAAARQPPLTRRPSPPAPARAGCGRCE